MRTQLHLVTMPWATPQNAPLAVSCLKAYVEQAIVGCPAVKNYSPYFSIPFVLGDRDADQFFADYCGYGEVPYLLLYAGRFGLPGVKRPGLVAAACRRLSEASPASKPLRPAVIRALHAQTRGFIENELGPSLDPDALNIVGFTMNYDQVCASLFCAQLLQRAYPQQRLLFLFGGNSASLPQVAGLFRRTGMRGFLAIGEGEKKLELVLRAAMNLPENAGEPEIEAAVRHSADGILHTFDEFNLHEREEKFFATQFPSMEMLPQPDYQEYFATVRRLALSDDDFALARKNIAMMAEGSRGCFAHCDFCGENATWARFRKQSPERVVADTLALIERYRCTNVNFVDNVCDTWADKFANSLLERGLRFPFFMDLRAHHPERFWTKLALAGLKEVQIGIESVSAGLLAQIGKGVPVVQNLSTQKYLLELGIESLSNLMLHHPRATLEDIEETRRVLECVPHFRLFPVTRFILAEASPLYAGLRPDERLSLRPAVPAALPASLRPFCPASGYEPPESLRPSEAVAKAWRGLARWHARYCNRPEVRDAFLRVTRLPDHQLLIQDYRDGSFREAVLAGESAAIYDVCHRGIRIDGIVRETGLPAARVATEVEALVSRRLLLLIDGHYLSIALRPRDELVERFYRARGLETTVPATPPPYERLVVLSIDNKVSKNG